MRFRQISGTFNIEIITENKKAISKQKYILLQFWYKFLLLLFKVLKFVPKIYKKRMKYRRKLSILEVVYVNQVAKCWYCNCCGNVVFKGDLRKGSSVLMNCPHCFSVYQVSPDYNGHNGRLCQRAAQKGRDDTPKMVAEDFTIDNGVRYSEKICGVEYNIKEKY